MTEKKTFFTKEESLILRGIAILLVLISHFAGMYEAVFINRTLQYACSRLGVYGVDIFFLVSGYGLVKSAAKRKIGWRFLWNRIKNMYLPYLLIVGIMELYAGELQTGKEWYRFLTGYDYWYIRNTLVFYLLFFAVYRLARKDWQRIVLVTAAIGGYTLWLVYIGRPGFWYVSNIAFWMGIVLAQYERKLLKAAKLMPLLQLLVFSAGMVWVVKSGLDMREVPMTKLTLLKRGSAASAIWTCFCIQAAGRFANRLGFLQPVGKISLELYLLHLFVYERTAEYLPGLSWTVQCLLVIGVTAVLAWGINSLFSLLWKAVERL